MLELVDDNADTPVPRRSALVLQEDPDLAEMLPAADRERATNLLRAPVLEVPPGPWLPPEAEDGAYGVLILDGLVARTVSLGKAMSVELLGPGFIFRHWDESTTTTIIPNSSTWEIVEPASLALLGRQATVVIGHWPELASAFAARLLRRVRSQGLLLAAANFTRVEDRLLAALWHLASMWGRVGPDGIVLPFRLTHETLARLVGARRPSVTLAMGALKREGRLLRRPESHYVLLGEAPSWLDELDEELVEA